MLPHSTDRTGLRAWKSIIRIDETPRPQPQHYRRYPIAVAATHSGPRQSVSATPKAIGLIAARGKLPAGAAAEYRMLNRSFHK
jgi:hypothetical protein